MRERFILIGLFLLAFALRVYRLDAQSIWWDEGISLHLATSSPAEIIADRAANIHPPLYFFVLKVWVALTGISVFSARFFSVLASLLLVVGVFALAKRWFGQPTAWLSASFAAFSPLSVVYAQEIRAYALLPLVYLALLFVTREVTRNPEPENRAWWLLLGVVETVGLHLHYMVLFAVAYVGIWFLLAFTLERRWADLRRWVITQLAVGLVSLPWLLVVLTRWSDVVARTQIGRGLVEPVRLGYLLRQVWVFHLTGLSGIAGRGDV
ncbi:MAG: glycosyltransferase family 39 protein, partial [Candidatus Thorarchaeota archaeon]